MLSNNRQSCGIHIKKIYQDITLRNTPSNLDSPNINNKTFHTNLIHRNGDPNPDSSSYGSSIPQHNPHNNNAIQTTQTQPVDVAAPVHTVAPYCPIPDFPISEKY
ncbi:hypothetical protein C1646_778080 [Rhizophagus diaphanus]|nr:hypothetical protein C1646_778080 [Rhizophagus diaphanus] [Rhizophagus sp. MUCL 43196]